MKTTKSLFCKTHICIPSAKLFAFGMFLVFTSNLGFSQSGPVSDDEIAPIRATLDELLDAWYLGRLTVDTNVSDLNRYGFKPYDIPLYSDKVYKKRLEKLQSPIPLGYNPVVKRFIELYVKDKRDQVENMLGLSHYYFPMIEAELDKNGLPLELKYITIIESALNTHAVSKSGATGLWQFMYGTARMYDLQITSYVDERRDPYKLTEKAVIYLKDLYTIYQDWLYVIAAYNCGPGSVNKAIQRSGYKSDFWEVYPYLPNETRGYVPAFIAANYVMNYYVEHNLYPKNIYNPGFLDTIHVYKRLDFSVISKSLQMTENHIKELNPQYKLDIIPQSLSGDPYVLRLPVGKATRFSNHRSRIYKYQELLDEKEQLALASAEKVQNITPYSSSNTNEYSLIVYNVKSGDTKELIAEWYDCTVTDLDRWNNFPGGIVKEGKTVNIYVPKTKFDKYTGINSLSYSEKMKLTGKSSSTSVSETAKYIYYTVKQGDTLWAISKKFPGNTADEIKELNKIDEAGIKPGQTIKIKDL